METKTPFFNKLALSVWWVLILFLGIFVFPWKVIDWGSIRFASERMVTVTGSSEKQTKNQIARFTAGVTSVKDKKEDAVNEVNTKMDEIVKALKSFGIKTEDIQTQSASIYQMQETFYEDGRQKSRPGQWSVNSNVEIILRDVDRAADLSDLLSKSGANNVYGPTFSIDTTDNFEEALVADAIADAKTKAEAMARASGASLGEVVSVVEGASGGGVFPLMAREAGGGGGAVVEPGSSTISKTVTVTFRLK